MPAELSLTTLVTLYLSLTVSTSTIFNNSPPTLIISSFTNFCVNVEVRSEITVLIPVTAVAPIATFTFVNTESTPTALKPSMFL